MDSSLYFSQFCSHPNDHYACLRSYPFWGKHKQTHTTNQLTFANVPQSQAIRISFKKIAQNFKRKLKHNFPTPWISNTTSPNELYVLLLNTHKVKPFQSFKGYPKTHKPSSKQPQFCSVISIERNNLRKCNQFKQIEKHKSCPHSPTQKPQIEKPAKVPSSDRFALTWGSDTAKRSQPGSFFLLIFLSAAKKQDKQGESWCGKKP